jgi:Ca2+-binding RTX toxin-like protein
MGTYNGNSDNNTFYAHKESLGALKLIKKWKSWSIYGYGGNDYLVGGPKNDYISGSSGNDTLVGGDGDDKLYGGTHNDYLYGGNGDDFLNGYGWGINEYDTLSGGAGKDLFILGDSSGVFYKGSGYAVITDFNWQDDKIQVKGSIKQYSLSFENLAGTGALDTVIRYNGDIIGVVQDNTNVWLSADFVTV